MSLECGIVGLPNVGKSSLFNVLSNAVQAQANNYPFCTIEPNKASVPVDDERLNDLAKLSSSKKITPNFIKIVDIAGLVKGASKGEGLGNQFLGNIREVDAIMHVVRCFEDDNVVHVENKVDPISDIETIETELLLADLSSLEKQLINLKKKRSNDKQYETDLKATNTLYDYAKEGRLLFLCDLSEDEIRVAKTLNLLTLKKMMYVANISESNSTNNELLDKLMDFARKRKMPVVPICIKVESEIISFSDEDKAEFLQMEGFGTTALNKVIKECYDLLNLITFFTSGPEETRAWNVSCDAIAPQAAGKIHSDMEKGFIRAEVISFDELMKQKSMAEAKNNGKIRVEGKEYEIKDGDVCYFRFNV